MAFNEETTEEEEEVDDAPISPFNCPNNTVTAYRHAITLHVANGHTLDSCIHATAIPRCNVLPSPLPLDIAARVPNGNSIPSTNSRTEPCASFSLQPRLPCVTLFNCMARREGVVFVPMVKACRNVAVMNGKVLATR